MDTDCILVSRAASEVRGIRLIVCFTTGDFHDLYEYSVSDYTFWKDLWDSWI